MDEPDATETPVPKPETMSVPKFEFFTIMIAAVGIGVTLGGITLNAAGDIETQIAATNARLDSAIAEAAADRRASDAKMAEFRNRMDEFDRHMRRLGERQARLEGQREGTTRQ